ncbi:MAG: hypothetical protein DRJ10_12010 [Bacteroidetes bacterium]|nr:MAG: hypothetical protein DRJ10_12010 [Bacteroidota bacterium]
MNMMNRRKAIKRMGLSFGYIAATPTVLSILESCGKESQISWTPKFFLENEAIVIQKLIDLILPPTDNIPGALDVDVPQFIDSYYHEVVEIKKGDTFKKGINLIINILGDNVAGADMNQYDSLLAKFLKARQKEIEEFKINEENNLIYHTLTNLRSTAVWAFKTSQKIGKEVLAYDPIPVVQIGCMSLDEATGGKEWSLMN